MTLGGRAAGLAALAASLLLAVSASAETMTLGPSEIPTSEPLSFFSCQFECHAAFTLAQQTSAYPDVAPAGGVITSWRVSGQHSPLTLRVLEPAPGGLWVGAGTSTAAANIRGEANPTELAISAGDLIGVDVGLAGGVGYAAVPGAEYVVWNPLIAEGEARPAAPGGESKLLLLDAQVELTPVVTSVSPASGSTAGGQTVSITGKYLNSAVNVVFGAHPATTFSVDLSGEHITATTPASGAGPVDVRVSNQHSTSQTVNADRYTFVAPAGPPGGSAPPGGAGGQGGAPIVSGFRESASRWRLGSALPHISSAPVGTTFAFTLSATANVSLTFRRVLSGRRTHAGCVAPSHGNRGKPRCKRFIPAGSLAVPGHAGLDKASFQGRLSRTRKLTPGNYTATVTARDSHGPKALARPLSFTILR